MKKETKEREFRFTDHDFQSIQAMVGRHTGIKLSEAKRDMVYSRLSRRLRALKITNFKDYCEMLEEDTGEELVQFTNAITTNLTSFFRENHHFEYLRNTLLPDLIIRNSSSRRIRIWSAGCSTGEEPYSLAMTIKESVPNADAWDIKILATDLDSNVLASAREGTYALERIEGIDERRRRRWFLKNKNNGSGVTRVIPELQKMITFKQLNLMHEWPMKGPFDIIFCRNVVIYFDKPTQKILFGRYADLMGKDGHLFVGHSETLYRVSDNFDLIGSTIYKMRN
ncbi:MAG: protein-glutamate O-methyltransferase [Gammaproteobacteria bacterium]|nr:MAG: protein-glutamate O-methyltransferase [Gammaproteobacteria bacterium]